MAVMKYRKNIAFVPSSEYFCMDRLFDKSYGLDNRNLHNFLLKKHLSNNGYNVHTIDMFEDLNSIDVIIFELIDFDILKRFNFEFKNKLNILLPWEPEVVLKLHSYKSLTKISKWFDFVLTWNDSLIDGVKFLKIHYPHKLESRYGLDDVDAFESKKLLVQISSNFRSSHNLELYTLRAKMNKLMSEAIQKQFDFYGKGWKNKFSYKGVIENKSDVMSNYKFSLCFENMKNGYGYVTEKIFDCFSAGVVPIYYGADNITDYIPGECFIDYRKFGDPYLLLDFIENIDYLTWSEYLLNAKLYLESKAAQEFSIDNYIRTISETIHKDNVTRKSGFLDRIMLYSSAYRFKFIKNLKKVRFLRLIKNYVKIK